MTAKLSGHYLPLSTIAWGISFFYLFGNIESLGRFDGISGLPPFSIAGHSLIDARAVFYPIWISVLVAVVLSENLLDSRMGRAIRALRCGSIAAESFGVDTARAKLVVFDIFFTEPGDTVTNHAFAQAIREQGKVVLAGDRKSVV